MTQAIGEDVTFGGAGLDRAAELRADEAAMRRARADPGSRCLLFWQGNILIEEEARRVAMLPLDHPVMTEVEDEEPVFLARGLDGGFVFAHDISGWQPADMAMRDAPHGWDTRSLPQHPAFGRDHAFADLRGIMAGLTAEEAELAATGRALFSWHDSHRFCARCGHPSEMIEAGWQRQCTSCEARHFPRTDPVVIMLITHGDHVLLGRSHGWPEGMYSTPAGFVEPGETIEAAVRREVLEETAIRVGNVDYVCSQPWPFPNSLMFGCRGEALSASIEVDPVELDDALWLSREDLVQVRAGEHPAIKPPRRGAIAEYLLSNWLADRLV